jgi:transketolase
VRAAFAGALLELARQDERIVLLTADLGYSVLEEFAREMPGRFFNVGVAEQNMVGMATGLADAGWIPFVYSIAPFAVLRPFEFIRNGPIAHRLPVRIAGIGGGFEYGHNGLSHFGMEDIGVTRGQPGLRVVVPADAAQARNAILATWNLDGPTYYRLGKDDRPRVPGLDGRFALGEAQLVREGTDVLLISTGAISVNAAAAVELLAARGVSAGLLIVDQFNSGPMAGLDTALRSVPRAVTVEAHYIANGLGSFVAERIAEESIVCRLVRCGVRTTPDGRTGSEAYMNARHGLAPEQIADAAMA